MFLWLRYRKSQSLSLLKIEDSEGAIITLHSTNASGLATSVF